MVCKNCGVDVKGEFCSFECKVQYKYKEEMLNDILEE